MAEGTGRRRLGGLTTVLLGLTGIFSSLTLVAGSRPGLAAAFAAIGVTLVLVGLKCLPTDSS